MARLVIYTVLCLIVGSAAKPRLENVEMGSGESEGEKTTPFSVGFLDENGDIPTTFGDLNGLENKIDESVTKSPDYMEDLEETIALVDETRNDDKKQGANIDNIHALQTENGTVIDRQAITNPESTTVTVNQEPSTEAATESEIQTTTQDTTVTTTISPTEIEETSATSPSPDTTTSTTTTTMMPITTTSTPQTTTSSSPTAVTGKADKSADHPKSQQQDENDVCVFLNPEGFTCSEQVVCYGEGEIDCDVEDIQLIEDKASSSSSDDYDEDDISDDETIATFPPNLVGVVTPKKISFFNMQSFTTEETSENVMTTLPPEVENPTERVDSSTVMVGDVNQETTEHAETTEHVSTVGITEKAKFDSEMVRNTVTEETTSTAMLETTESAILQSTTMTILFPGLNSNGTADDVATMPPPQNSADESDAKSEEPAGNTGNIRRKRGFFSSDGAPEENKKLAVDYLQRKYLNPTCRLSGDIQCMPVPTTANCRGKTFCQAKERKSDTAESSKAEGMNYWVIIIVVFAGVFAFLSIVMATYMIVHSCKKLKVQPTHDVTPLNYITKKPETNEAA